MRARAGLIAHAAACVVVVVAFLWVSAPKIAPPGTFRPWLQYHTTDNYLRALIGREAGSSFLLHIFDALADKAPVAVAYAEEENADTLLSYVLAYLAWPKDVRAVPVRAATYDRQMELLRSGEFSAVFFCGIKPPAGSAPIVPLGDQLVMVPQTPPAEPAP